MNRSFEINPQIEEKIGRFQIEKAFSYHPPKLNQPVRYVEIRDKAKEFAYYLEENCPNSREKSLAMTHLEEVVFWANASIARNE